MFNDAGDFDNKQVGGTHEKERGCPGCLIVFNKLVETSAIREVTCQVLLLPLIQQVLLKLVEGACPKVKVRRWVKGAALKVCQIMM